MDRCSINVVPIQKWDKFSPTQCLKNEVEHH
jgi:hypothetical protein